MKKFIILFSIATLFSCNSEEVLEIQQLEQNAKKEELKEISKLIGLTLNDDKLRSQIINEVKQIDDYSNSVSIAYLLGKDDKISPYEKRKINKISSTAKNKRNESSNLFKNELIKTYNQNIENFPNIKSELKSTNPNENYSARLSNELVEYMADNNLEMYFPYEENFNWETTDEFSITYEDGNPYAIHEGYIIDGIEYDFITGIDENYLYNNPTIAIIPIDNYYLGEQVAYEINNFEYITDPYDYTSLPTNSWNGTAGSTTNPPPPANPKIRLDYNANPFDLAENHLLTTFIPQVRVKGTDWKRTLSKALRMKIAKAGSEVAINPTGGLTATPGAFYFRFDISASDLRNHRWKNVGILWEPNWHKVKSAQQMVIWGLRKNASESTVSVDSKLSMDANGNFTPSNSISVSNTVKSGEKGIFRGNKELDRNHTLSTIVGGSEFDNATVSYEGKNYSIRRINSLYEFFFVHDYTSY